MARFEPSHQDRLYLDGVEFSSGANFATTPTRPVDRFNLLTAACRGKSVLHVGFADHAPLIDNKFRTGNWLHGQLAKSASSCAGLDIDTDVVEGLKEQGIEDIWAGDISRPETIDPSLLGRTFEVIVLGEVLEHTGNPVDFLRSVRDCFGQPGSSLLCTVPNAWALRSFTHAIRGSECINTDHRFWFTPYTLAKVLVDAGYFVEQVETCRPEGAGRSFRSRVRGRLHQRFGLLSETLVAHARVPRAPEGG